MSAAVVIVAFVVQEGRNIVWGLQRGLQCHRPAKRHGTRSAKTDVNLLHSFFFSFTICVNTEVIYLVQVSYGQFAGFVFGLFGWLVFFWVKLKPIWKSIFAIRHSYKVKHLKKKKKRGGGNKHGNEGNFWKNCFQDVLNERVHGGKKGKHIRMKYAKPFLFDFVHSF